MNRRTFVVSSGVATLGAFAPRLFSLDSPASAAVPFQWQTSDLVFSFDVRERKLRQSRLLPVGTALPEAVHSFGVEVALQCSGENSPDQGMKSGMGQPGARLLFAGKREESTPNGKRLICMHNDPVLQLNVESVYESFDGLPVVRRYARIANAGTAAVGIEFLSSAMLHGLVDPQSFDRELVSTRR